MDPLVLAAGTAVVGAMATDGWQTARGALVAWWRRVRPEQADEVDSALAEARPQILAARESDNAVAEEVLVSDWQVRLQRLLLAEPRLADELRRLLDEEITPVLPAPEQARAGSVAMTATASKKGRVYMAGRDQHITER